MALEWKDEFSVNVREVDLQRRKLVEMVSELDKGIRTGRDEEALARSLAGVTQYARYHFATEERLMAQSRYPDAGKHVEEHQRLINVVEEFNATFKRGSAGLNTDSVGFLENWLAKHMLDADKRMGKYLSAACAASGWIGWSWQGDGLNFVTALPDKRGRPDHLGAGMVFVGLGG
jgi:hemerythrin-like metal-binding protein